jgi:hypoxanthine-DNA glycosylase
LRHDAWIPADGGSDAMKLPDPALRADPVRLLGMPAVIGAKPRVLVLGSMPGAQSLAHRQYYAHPRNHFWRIIEDVFRIPRELRYAQRTARLRQQGVALWDVVGECSRHGSLDAHIARDSLKLNDICGLLAAHPSCQRIIFNGVFAEQVFRKRILGAAATWHGLILQRLPSTSPANAGSRYEQKLAAWRPALTATTPRA